MPTLIDQVYYELGLRTVELENGSRKAVAADDAIAASAQRAEEAIAELLEAMMQTPEGAQAMEEMARRLVGPLDRVASGMSSVADAADWNYRPLTAMTEGMSKAGRQAAQLRVQEAALAEQQKASGKGFDLSAQGASKLRGGLIALALSATNTTGPLGNVVQGALLLGAGSIAVTGMAAGISLLTALYRAFTKEAREASEAAKKVIDEGQQRLLQVSTAQAANAVNEAAAAVAAVEAARKEQGFSDGRAVSLADRQAKADSDTELARVVGELETRRRLLTEARIAERNENNAVLNDISAARERLEQSIAASRSFGLPTDELSEQLADLKKLEQAVEAVPLSEQSGVRSAIAAQQLAASNRAKELRDQLVARFNATVPATIDATAEAIERLRAELISTGATAAEVDRRIAPLLGNLAAAKIQFAEGLGPEQGLDVLDSERQRLVSQLSSTQTTEKDVQLLRQIAALDAARLRASQRLVVANNDQAAATEVVLDNTGDMVPPLITVNANLSEVFDQVTEIARGAIGIAQAFGAASDGAAAMLQNVLTTAAAVPGLVSQIDKIGKVGADGVTKLFDPKAFTAGLVGVLGGIAGVVSGFFGENPQDKRAQQSRDKNNEVIEKLTDEIGNLNLDVTGKEFSEGVKGIAALLAVDSKQIGKRGDGSFLDSLVDRGRDINKDAIDRILKAQGSSFRELKELAQAFDIDLNTDNVEAFRSSLKELQKALAATELTRFAESFEGQLQALQDQFDLFDITDPIDQLKELQRLSQQTNSKGELIGSKAIADALKGLNLDDPSQRAEAERRLLALFEKLRSGELTPEDLGLTLDQFRDFLKRFEATVDRANEEDGSQTGGKPVQETFGVTRGVTEVTGNRLAGYLDAISTDVSAIRQLIERATQPVGLIPAPAYPQLGTTTAAGGGVVINITNRISMEGGTSAAQAAALGAAFGRGNAAEIDRQLGAILRQKKLTSGQTRSR